MKAEVANLTWRNSPWTVVISSLAVFICAAGLLVFLAHRHSPPYRTSPNVVCRNNLKQIEMAKTFWAEDEEQSTNTVPIEADLFGTNIYLKRPLVCPAGGTYTIGSMSENPRCSIPGHTLDR